MRVVIVINGLERGGGEHVVFKLVRALHHEISFSVYTISRRGYFATQIEAMGVPVRCLLRRGVPKALKWTRFLYDIRRADVIHSHFFYSDILARVVASINPGARLLCTRHETGFWMNDWQRRIEPLLYKGFRHCLCVSAAVVESMHDRGVDPCVLTLCAPGVTVHDTLRRDQSQKHIPTTPPNPSGPIMSVGRLETIKGHDVLLGAFSLWRQRRQDPKDEERELLIFGDGACRKKLQALAQELGVAEVVRFRGAVSQAEVQRFLSRASMFVLPSRSEGMPLALMEAFAAGLPCVAAEVGGVAEIIDDGENGLLVPPEDPLAMCEAMLKITSSPKLATQLANAARQRALERFDQRRFIAQTRAFYSGDDAASTGNPANFHSG